MLPERFDAAETLSEPKNDSTMGLTNGELANCVLRVLSSRRASLWGFPPLSRRRREGPRTTSESQLAS